MSFLIILASTTLVTPKPNVQKKLSLLLINMERMMGWETQVRGLLGTALRDGSVQSLATYHLASSSRCILQLCNLGQTMLLLRPLCPHYPQWDDNNRTMFYKGKIWHNAHKVLSTLHNTYSWLLPLIGPDTTGLGCGYQEYWARMRSPRAPLNHLFSSSRRLEKNCPSHSPKMGWQEWFRSIPKEKLPDSQLLITSVLSCLPNLFLRHESLSLSGFHVPFCAMSKLDHIISDLMYVIPPQFRYFKLKQDFSTLALLTL